MRGRDVPEGQPTADCNFKANTHESVIHEEKERRADGGCLGFRRRRRTREGRGKLRKCTGNRKQVSIRACPNGATRLEGVQSPAIAGANAGN